MSLIPNYFFDAVTAIGVETPDGIDWVGTGFIYGKFISQVDNEKSEYQTYLVTNKHVLKNEKSIHVKFNSDDGEGSKDYKIELEKEGKPVWAGHPDADVDIAIFAVNIDVLKNDRMKYGFFCSKQHSFKTTQLISKEIAEGDGVFVLGFPMGNVDPERQFVICRSGVIARIRDLLNKRKKNFLIDVPTYPGNSGGPVIVRPDAMAIEGTQPNNVSALIGVVKSYIPYTDIAVSPQTGNPRITFEENSGLTLVEPVDYIDETIDLLVERANKKGG